jgi:flagellar biosynthesis protein FlhB
MADRSSKTEQPTERRLHKAREEGQFPSAREFVSALQFLVFLGLLAAGGEHWFAQFRLTAHAIFERAFTGDLQAEDLQRIAWQLFWVHLLPLFAAGMVVALATLAIRLATTRFGFSLKRLAPSVARLNPLARLRELPAQNLASLAQAVVLLPLFLWAVWVVARQKLEILFMLPLASVESGCRFLGASLMELGWKAAGVFLAFGAVDLFRQMRRYQRDLRMSRQEIKEEVKDVEGNPQMKARIRRLQRDRARRQMMKEIPKATAVIVNPTHYAVAIRYQMESMVAPLVVAKGKNYLALRIRQRAVEHQVPIVENPPLAQALYKSVEVGQEIPAHLYRAVAEILAYIFKLMNGRLPG